MLLCCYLARAYIDMFVRYTMYTAGGPTPRSTCKDRAFPLLFEIFSRHQNELYGSRCALWKTLCFHIVIGDFVCGIRKLKLASSFSFSPIVVDSFHSSFHRVFFICLHCPWMYIVPGPIPLLSSLVDFYGQKTRQGEKKWIECEWSGVSQLVPRPPRWSTKILSISTPTWIHADTAISQKAKCFSRWKRAYNISRSRQVE